MKSITNKPLSRWWYDAREHYKPDEIIAFLQNNQRLLKKKIARLDNNRYLYRLVHRLFTLFSFLASIADWILRQVKRILLHIPGIKIIFGAINGLRNSLNFKEAIAFLHTKMFSLRHPPHNEGDIKVIEEIMEYASRHGFDFKKAIPGAMKLFHVRKNQLMQHKFFQEFSKSTLERILAIQFPFNRNFYPVLPDSSFWHKLYQFLENSVITDVILVNRDGKRVSQKHGSAEEIASTDVYKALEKLMEIRKSGRRIFFTGHHEGYLGPYFVRSAVRNLGFDDLTKNCNTIAGPRMFSNIILRSGASNVGNLFLTVPSQKTTVIQTHGLADELKKTARRTQELIKMPDSGLKLIEKYGYDEFMNAFVLGSADHSAYTAFLTRTESAEFEAYFKASGFQEAMKDFGIEDYSIFKNVMRESFLIFPEGSRSYIDPDGSVVMKYVNLKFFEIYMRKGDYIAPISVVGGSDVTNGWRLRKARFGISMAEPYEVTARMMKNPEEAGLNLVKQIASLPNIKKVKFKEEIQFKTKESGKQK